MKRDSRGRFVSRTRRNPAQKRNAKGQFVSSKRQGYRKNPYVGDLLEITYDPHDGDPRPFMHKAGDRGRFLPKGKPAKLYVNPRTGKPSIRGNMRWVRPFGLIG